MKNPTPRSLCKAICEVKHGDNFCHAVFATAFGKFTRHIRNKYGNTDWRSEVAENGGLHGIEFFYAESEGGVVDTFNRASAKS